MPPRTSAKKKGAQPANKNALKHGFYARAMTAAELNDLAQSRPDLTNEIELLRALIRRTTEATETAPDTLTAIAEAMTKLAGMLKTNQYLTGGTKSLDDILRQILGEP